MTRVLSVLTSILIVLVFWLLSDWLGLVPRLLLPTPWEVLHAGLREVESGRLARNVADSTFRLGCGYVLGATAGICVGIVTGWFLVAERALLPPIEILRPIPPLAWVPLAIIWFGIGDESKIFLIATTAFFPVVIATYRGVQHVETYFIRAALSMDVSPLGMMARVALPASLPDITTGLRIAWTLAITALVGAEMIAGDSGLGFMIMNSMNGGRFDTVIFGILFLGLFSVFTDYLLRAIFIKRVLHWHSGMEGLWR